MTCAETWMNLEDIKGNEPDTKRHILWFHLHAVFVKIKEMGRGCGCGGLVWWLPGAGRGEDGIVQWVQLQCWRWKFWRQDLPQCEYAWNYWTVHLETIKMIDFITFLTTIKKPSRQTGASKGPHVPPHTSVLLQGEEFDTSNWVHQFIF